MKLCDFGQSGPPGDAWKVGFRPAEKPWKIQGELCPILREIMEKWRLHWEILGGSSIDFWGFNGKSFVNECL